MKNKKLIASLTLAGFMATSFVPAAGLGLNVAYAAAADVSVGASYLATADANPEVDTDEAVEVKLGLLDRNNQAVDVTDGTVVLWAESTSGRFDDAIFVVKKADSSYDVSNTTVSGDEKGIIALTNFAEKKESKVNVKFTRPGKYTLHAALLPTLPPGTEGAITVDDLKNGTKKVSDLRSYELTTEANNKVVTVAAKNTVSHFKVGNQVVAIDGQADEVVIANANGIEKTPVKVTVFKSANATVGRGTTVKVSTSSENIKIDKTSFVTDNAGAIEFKVSGSVKGKYKVYVNVDGKEITIPVTVGSRMVDRIVAVKAPKAPISVDEVEANDSLEDFVRLEIKDINGSTVSAFNAEVPAPKVTSDNARVREDYIQVVEKPAKSKVEAKDFKLVRVGGKDYFTVQTEKSLVAGKYVVRFAADNGKTVDVAFEVAEFGKAVSLKLEYDVETVELGKYVSKADIKFVDEKGVEKPAKESEVNLGYSGYAVYNFQYDGKTSYNKKYEVISTTPVVENGDFTVSKGGFFVKNDDKYLGSKITVTAVASRQNLVAVAELTVAQDGRNLKFATNSGVINANNTVEFKIVDGSGKSVSTGKIDSADAVILSSSNKDAKVSTNIEASDVDSATGEGKLTLTSDKPTTVEVQVFVRDTNRKYYAGTLTYSFGETALNGGVNRFVVMSFNSDIANVNNTNVKLDAAPIAKNNRTFVPFRAVAEAFGAEVGYDEKTKKVTTKLDGKTVELTLGSKKLMVNDQEKAMDVEPFSMNSRTMVPVRFVAEELGFKVTAVRDAKRGGVAAVIFSR